MLTFSACTHNVNVISSCMKTPASSTYINERVEIAVSSDTCRTIVMEIFILSLLSLSGSTGV